LLSVNPIVKAVGLKQRLNDLQKTVLSLFHSCPVSKLGRLLVLWICIHFGGWIRIQEGRNVPIKVKTFRVLKCWMFSSKG
jgi:hypothetical protein